MSQTFHKIQLAEKIQETVDAVSLVFDIPNELKEQFSFRSGQYINIDQQIGGEEIRRSYSICCAPHEGAIKVNVKKVEGGKMSTWVLDSLQQGELLSISEPEGNFTMDFDASKRRNHYFIAAGSGITPVISLIKDGLESEPLSTFVLLYGNKNEDRIIFNDELNSIKEQFGDQFYLYHTLSEKKQKKLLSFWNKSNDNGSHLAGRIDPKKLNSIWKEVPTSKIENHFYICGPGEMISTINKWLKDQSVPGMKIHKEYFTNPDQHTGDFSDSQEAKLTYKNLHGHDGETEIPKGKTVLEALMDAGVDPPYSCMNGVCSSCVAKLVEGEVEMETCLALEDDEIAAGYILTCQSHPKTAVIALEYEG